MKKLLATLILGSSIFALTGCVDSNLDPDEIEYESFTREAMQVTFEKPKEWYEPIDSVDQDGFYIFVVPNQFSVEDKVEGRFQVTKTQSVEGKTVEDAYQVFKELKMEVLGGDSVSNLETIHDGKDVKILGQAAKELEVHYNSTFGEDERKVVEVGAVVVHDGYIYIVEYFDEKPDYDKYRKVLDHLYETLEVSA